MERYEQWRYESIEDLKTARILFDAQRFNASAFYCQQSAEKAVKALLIANHEMPWGHSVAELIARVFELADSDNSSDDLLSSARELDRHYIPARYPDALPSGTPFDNYDRPLVERTLLEAEKVHSFVEERLNEA